ncbi:hypothetical protein MSG28_000896 [Choristoneura fumiferana]|uniref:Uncharacterized protein n=1 Tax=Choristoneura fumiferana TaxID=7141 RepID=A0ACC0K2V9_CHOFU|nr:hypothetical protein MSG28_000896 [Choristoneura fumiferana]
MTAAAASTLAHGLTSTQFAAALWSIRMRGRAPTPPEPFAPRTQLTRGTTRCVALPIETTFSDPRNIEAGGHYKRKCTKFGGSLYYGSAYVEYLTVRVPCTYLLFKYFVHNSHLVRFHPALPPARLLICKFQQILYGHRGGAALEACAAHAARATTPAPGAGSGTPASAARSGSCKPAGSPPKASTDMEIYVVIALMMMMMIMIKVKSERSPDKAREATSMKLNSRTLQSKSDYRCAQYMRILTNSHKISLSVYRTNHASGIQEGNVTKVGAVEADVAGVFDVALRTGDHASLDGSLAGISHAITDLFPKFAKVRHGEVWSQRNFPETF